MTLLKNRAPRVLYFKVTGGYKNRHGSIAGASIGLPISDS